MSKLRLLLTIWLCLAVVAAHAERMQLEMIPLNHRTAEDLLPIIRPLVVEGGTVTASGNQLILKTTPANIAEIKRILAEIDTAPRRLMITVRQDTTDSGRRGEQSLSGAYSSGDAHASAGAGRRGRDGLVIRGRDEDGNVIEYRTRQRDSVDDNQNSYRVQALEGRPAFIRTGREVPVTSRSTHSHGGAVVQHETTQLHDATSGFYALPRLSGDRVTLLIAPRLAEAGPGPRFDIQEVETTVSGRLGEWLTIGGIDQSTSRRDSGVLSSRESHTESHGRIMLKVEEVGTTN